MFNDITFCIFEATKKQCIENQLYKNWTLATCIRLQFHLSNRNPGKKFNIKNLEIVVNLSF